MRKIETNQAMEDSGTVQINEDLPGIFITNADAASAVAALEVFTGVDLTLRETVRGRVVDHLKVLRRCNVKGPGK